MKTFVDKRTIEKKEESKSSRVLRTSQWREDRYRKKIKAIHKGVTVPVTQSCHCTRYVRVPLCHLRRACKNKKTRPYAVHSMHGCPRRLLVGRWSKAKSLCHRVGAVVQSKCIYTKFDDSIDINFYFLRNRLGLTWKSKAKLNFSIPSKSR